MPSELEKGVIKPLAAEAIPLVAWRLRDIGKPDSRVVMENLPVCANCHSFSADGKTHGHGSRWPGEQPGPVHPDPGVAPDVHPRCKT